MKILRILVSNNVKVVYETNVIIYVAVKDEN